MNPPILIVLERHWDVMPKIFIKEALPQLKALGYNTIASEAPFTYSEEELSRLDSDSILESKRYYDQAKTFLDNVNISIDSLMKTNFKNIARTLQLYVSSQHYQNFTMILKEIPAKDCLHDLFVDAKQLGFSRIGIDMEDVLNKIGAFSSMKERVSLNTSRESHFFNEICKIQATEGHGLVVLMGSLHFKGLYEHFEKNNMLNNVVFTMPYENIFFTDKKIEQDLLFKCRKYSKMIFPISQKKDFSFEIETLIGKLSKNQFNQFQEIQTTSTTAKLNRQCPTKFTSYQRSGFFVDAISDAVDNNKKILEKNKIPYEVAFFRGKESIIVRDLNVKEVATQIQEAQLSL